MLIESDIVIAHFKRKNRLKSIADEIFSRIKKGEMKAEISTEIFHEVFYVLIEFTDYDTIISNFAYLISLDNLKFLKPSPEIYVTAVTLMKQYDISSIFDAIYAAQTLLQTDDKIILSTDHVYDRIKGIERKDPRDFLKKR